MGEVRGDARKLLPLYAEGHSGQRVDLHDMGSFHCQILHWNNVVQWICFPIRSAGELTRMRLLSAMMVDGKSGLRVEDLEGIVLVRLGTAAQ
jgi:hypothetical protein